MEMTVPALLYLGLLLVCGLLFGVIASRFQLPRVAAYVIAGMLFSPDLLGRIIHTGAGEWSETLTTTALGIIAYLIGGSITMQQLLRMGKMIVGSALGESFGAVLVVFLAVFFLIPDIGGVSVLQLALAFAAIAASTAPAGTVAVLHQYRAHGPLSTTLLGVVALDDALGIIFFSVIMVIVAGESWGHGLVVASREIGGALILGAVTGGLLARAGKHIRQGGMRLPMVLGSILLVIGVAEAWKLSPLLSAMSLGFSSRFFLKASGDRLFAPVEYLEEMVFIIFFTLAGAHFEFSVFLSHFDLILIYFFARIIGKLAGASIGAQISGAPKTIVYWLGPGLIPQAGVAVGLALTLSHQPIFHEVSIVIVNVILATTLLYEVLGPFAARLALERSGELGIKRNRGKL